MKDQPTSQDNEWKWKVEDAARTLIKAEEIKNDKKLCLAAQVEMKRQMKANMDALNNIKSGVVSSRAMAKAIK